jgi:hypothetical protein
MEWILFEILFCHPGEMEKRRFHRAGRSTQNYTDNFFIFLDTDLHGYTQIMFCSSPKANKYPGGGTTAKLKLMQTYGK